MNNPQVEDGFVRICTEIVEAFAKSRFTPAESRILWAVLRFTYGWNRKKDQITISKFCVTTGLSKRDVCRATKSLVDRNILLRTLEGRGLHTKSTYWINKDASKWQEGDKIDTLPQGDKIDTFQGDKIDTLLFKLKTPLKTEKNTSYKDTKKNDNKVSNELILYIFNYFCIKNKKNILLNGARSAIIAQRIREGRTADEMKRAIDAFSKDTWVDRYKYCDIVYCLGVRNKVDQLDRWLASSQKDSAADSVDPAFQ